MSSPHASETPSGIDMGREELHFRRIDMRGYRRGDGLFEVEGRVTDRKPHEFTAAGGGPAIPPHEPLHDMGVRLIFDEAMIVRDVQTFTRVAPYTPCQDGGKALQLMKGVRIGPGWGSEVRSRLSGPRSCTHLMELLLPMATAAIQAMSAVRKGEPNPIGKSGRPWQIDSCYAYDAGREVVLQRWPQFHRPGAAGSEAQLSQPPFPAP